MSACTALQLLNIATLLCTSLANPTRMVDYKDRLFFNLLAELMSTADTCSEAELSPGCCRGACRVPGGNCYCDKICRNFNDCCSDVPEMLSCSVMTMPATSAPTTASTPLSCISSDRPPNSGCCTSGSTACSVNGGACYCDRECHAEGTCCHDIQELNCFPTNCAEAGKLGCVMNVSAGELCNVILTQQGGQCFCDANCNGDCCADAIPVIPPELLWISQRMRMKELAREMSAYQSRGRPDMQRDSLSRKYQAGKLARMQLERPYDRR